ncbi:hypothetical protein OKW29_004249 [Paraburkholderia sp. CI3]
MAADTPRANDVMKMSAGGYAALRVNEGVVMHYYNDAPVNGNCTWGVGTLAHLGPCTPGGVAARGLARTGERYLNGPRSRRRAAR